MRCDEFKNFLRNKSILDATPEERGRSFEHFDTCPDCQAWILVGAVKEVAEHGPIPLELSERVFQVTQADRLRNLSKN